MFVQSTGSKLSAVQESGCPNACSTADKQPATNSETSVGPPSTEVVFFQFLVTFSLF